MRCCGSDWSGLCLFCCYQPLCCQPTELIWGFFFFFLNFPILLPPPRWWSRKVLIKRLMNQHPGVFGFSGEVDGKVCTLLFIPPFMTLFGNNNYSINLFVWSFIVLLFLPVKTLKHKKSTDLSKKHRFS